MKIKYAVRRDDGTFVGNGGRGRASLDTAYLYSAPPEIDTSNFYVKPDLVDTLKMWEIVEVEQVRRIIQKPIRCTHPSRTS